MPETFNSVFAAFADTALRQKVAYPHYAVRFEDMHRRTEETMHAVCKVYGIDFDPVMLHTTLDGGDFLFPKRGHFVTGVNPLLVDDDGKYSVLKPSDVLAMAPFLRAYCENFGYEDKTQGLPSITAGGLSETNTVFDHLAKIRSAGPDEFPRLIRPTDL